MGTLRLPIIGRSASVGCTLKDKACDDILAAEAIQLKVHDAVEAKSHDSVLIEYEVPIWIDSVSHDPAVYLQFAGAGSSKGQTNNLGIVEGWHLSEPRQQFLSSRHICVDHSYPMQKSVATDHINLKGFDNMLRHVPL